MPEIDFEHSSHELKAKKYTAAIQQDTADAGSIGISGTPSFVIGRTAKD